MGSRVTASRYPPLAHSTPAQTLSAAGSGTSSVMPALPVAPSAPSVTLHTVYAPGTAAHNSPLQTSASSSPASSLSSSAAAAAAPVSVPGARRPVAASCTAADAGEVLVTGAPTSFDETVGDPSAAASDVAARSVRDIEVDSPPRAAGAGAMAVADRERRLKALGSAVLHLKTNNSEAAVVEGAKMLVMFVSNLVQYPGAFCSPLFPTPLGFVNRVPCFSPQTFPAIAG